MKFLIIGGDSLLGSSLAKYLTAQGYEVFQTTRKALQYDKQIYFDLSEEKEQWPSWPENIDTVFIAAALTNQAQCTQNPELTHYVNVQQTIDLVRQLQDKDMFVVYPSTNLVLPCRAPFQKAETPAEPFGDYAESKSLVERALEEAVQVAIVRLPKILDSDSGIIRKWSEQIEKQERITVYNNLKISPVSLMYAVEFLGKLMIKKQGGLWQISGDQDISYADLIEAFIEHQNISQEIRKLLDITEMESKGIAIPEFPSLDSSRVQSEFGIKPQSITDLLSDCFS